jgi:cytochrome c553
MFDFLGILILIVLIVVFGFLATRAWKRKNNFLRWVSMFFAGVMTLIPAAVLVLALIGFGKINAHFNNPISTLVVVGTPAQIARGEKLAHICMDCHSPNNSLPLSGADFVKQFVMPPIGTLYAPNLTPSGDIQHWTDGEVIRAIREGVHQSGRSLLRMPAENFRNMSDEDVQALVAYLRSQPATGGITPQTQFSILGAVFMNLADFRAVQQPIAHVTHPEAGTPAYGRYLVDITGCRSCHGTQLQGKVKNGQPGPPPGPNLTRIVPQWTEAQFMTFFNTGTNPSGAKVPILTLSSGFSSPSMPWSAIRAMTSDDELKAMYAYLHGLTIVEGPLQ